MYSTESSSAVIEVILTFAKVKIKNVDGIDLLHMVVAFTQLDVLGDGACHTIKDALKVVQLARLLYFHDDDFTLAVLGFDVNTVEFVLRVVLVALAFQ